MEELMFDLALDHAIRGNEYLLLDFWAPWCGPCKKQTEILYNVENEITILKINVDVFPNMTSYYEILSIPTLVFYKNGEIFKQVSGVQSTGQLLETIKELKGE